ncbi:hypothetical protein [Lysinibacillus xylanilyticus]|uniref:Uncharacterized protein n=1 Tax=Lysinibacillus xylanilyticus TaxID=582475 RepID=A0ABT4EQC2_9BACI|nr:hypothetical protein [Lysinibacillus xylanilyticus]MCY9547854.1 hypothetical protein [Lysinibacillus xylanilyticus]
MAEDICYVSLVVPRSFALYESEVPAQMFYLCESEAPATNVLSVRKRSASDKCFICAKAKRQQQSALSERKSPLVLQKDFYNKSKKDASHSRDTPF